MKFTVRQIAELVGGKTEGNDALEIGQFCKIEEGAPDGISFLANQKYESHIYDTEAAAVIVADGFEPKQPINATLIKVKDPYAAFATLMSAYQKLTAVPKKGVDKSATVDSSVNIPESVFLGPMTVVEKDAFIGENTCVESRVYIGERVKIGKNCRLYPGVTIYSDCEIGDNTTIHANAVIGCDGFGFAPQADGTYESIPQLGNVKIGNNVSIGANTTIDRATMGSTVIGDGCKIDNLVQIAHNVSVGENTVIAAQAGIAGSTKIGARCMIGGQVGITGHIQIADGTQVGAQTGISKSIKKENTSVSGSPHMELSQYLKTQVMLRKLPAYFNNISEIERKTKD